MSLVVKLVHFSPFPNAGITPFGDLSELDFESINLLTDFRAGSSPSFTVVDFSTYIEKISHNNASDFHHTILPPNFLLSLSYRPHDNTVLRLLSTTRASSGIGTINNAFKNSGNDIDLDTNSTSGENPFTSLMLSSGILYLFPLHSMYYPLQSTFSANTKHELAFIVSNGLINSCMDGDFVDDNPTLPMWDTTKGIDESEPVTISFSEHLHAINQLVG